MDVEKNEIVASSAIKSIRSNSIPKAVRIREIQRMAAKESPPRLRKLAFAFCMSISSISRQIAKSWNSIEERLRDGDCRVSSFINALVVFLI